jgi:hypothetical protein
MDDLCILKVNFCIIIDTIKNSSTKIIFHLVMNFFFVHVVLKDLSSFVLLFHISYLVAQGNEVICGNTRHNKVTR